MIIKRDHYVEALLGKRWNGKVKIITGIRRCGKSFLLSTLYKGHLKTEGVPEDCFVEIALDRKADLKYRNPNELYGCRIPSWCGARKGFCVKRKPCKL